MIGVSSSTVSAIIAQCSSARCPIRASLPTAPRRFPVSPQRSSSSPSRSPRAPPAASAPRSERRLSAGLRPRGLPSLQRAVLALLAPVRQMRRVQPFAAQQLADLTQTSARISLSKDLRLVLSGEQRRLACSTSSISETSPLPPTPSSAARPPSPYPSSATPSWSSQPAAAASTSLQLHSCSLHVRRAPFSPSKFIDSSMVSASPYVDRE